MLKEEDKDQGSSVSWKTYSRSVSWTERSPRKSNPNPRWNRKARACLAPLQPLSIIRPSIEEWPRAGCDDLGIWPNPPTPGARPGSLTPRENLTADFPPPPREFDCRKDKLAFFDKECSRILDHIYLGSEVIAKNREILCQRGITHVLNCVGSVCPEYFRNELVYKTLWLQDSPSEDITSILYDVFDYFEDVHAQGGRVLVHCCHGVSRSTSLVIAYLMWKEGQSFDDAFQHVKAAREVTNPNVGFACQLLQCQKRVHALPASPTSVLRMYRMAPHSPYDPLHLVPKMLCEPGAERLDSRGAFIIHIPSALYVWIGKHCSSVMSDDAMAAASQVIRYERAKGPVIIVKESEETLEFWDAFGYRRGVAEASRVNSEEQNKFSVGSDMVPRAVTPCPNQRKLDEYDLDFEIFNRALSGGVLPPFPLSGSGSETCLPARENGWNRLRKEVADGIVKKHVVFSKLDCSILQRCDEQQRRDACSELEDSLSPSDSTPSSSQNDSQDLFASCLESSVGSDTSQSESPSHNLVDSFSSFFVSKPKSASTSLSVAPSKSDYARSFTFSPSSSNWPDLLCESTQPAPHRVGSKDNDPSQHGFTEYSLSSLDESTCTHDNATSHQAGDRISACHESRVAGLCSTSGQPLLSLAERRLSSLSSRMLLPSIHEESHISENLPRCVGDDASTHVESNDYSREDPLEIDGEELISNANDHATDCEALSTLQDEKKCGTKFTDALYVWIGHKVTSEGSRSQMFRNESKYEDTHAHLETVGRSLLLEKGFDTDAPIKMVKEDEELVQHLANFW